jgi:hypothetical protein
VSAGEKGYHPYGQGLQQKILHQKGIRKNESQIYLNICGKFRKVIAFWI